MEIPTAAPGTRIPFFLLLAAVAAALFVTGPITFTLNTAKYMAFNILLAALAAAVLFRSLRRREAIPVCIPLLATYGAFVLLSVLPLLWTRGAYDPFATISTWMATFAMFLLLPEVFRNDRDTTAFFLFAAAAIVVLSAVGWTEFAGLAAPYGKIPSVDRIVSTVGNSDYLAGTLVLLLPLAYGALVHPAGRGYKLLQALCVISVVAGILTVALTRSKSAIAAAAVSAALLLVLSVRKRRIVFLLSLCCLGIFLIGGIAVLASRNADFTMFLSRRFRIQGLDLKSLFSLRLPIWQSAVRVWLSDPPWSVLFGSGPGGFYGNNYSLYPSDFRMFTVQRGTFHAHDEYLHILSEGGLFGLLAWLAYVAAPIVLNARTLRAADPGRRTVALSLLAALAGGLVHQLASPINRSPAAHVVFSLLIGLSWLNGRTAAPLRRGMPRFAAPALALCLLPFPLVSGIHRCMAESVLLRGVLESAKVSQDTRERALSWFRKSLQWRDSDVEALYQSLRAELSWHPEEVIRLADRIDSLVPDFRNIYRYRGIAQVEMGDFDAAVDSFSHYLKSDALEPSTWMHLAASLVMTGETDRSVSVLRDFFAAQHRLLSSESESRRRIAPGNLSFTEGAAAYRIDGTAIASKVRELAGGKDRNYNVALVSLYLLVGDVYRKTGYGDLYLDYYMMAAQSGLMTHGFVSDLYAANAGHYTDAKALRELAASKGTGWEAARYGRNAARYLGNMLALAPTPALEADFRALAWESEREDQ